MDFEQLESEIVERLSMLNDVDIDTVGFPENDAEITQPFDHGQISVAFMKSEYGDPIAPDVVAQEETIQVDLIIQSRKLRGSTGIHSIIKSAKTLLLGWRPTDGSKIQLVKIGFFDHKESIWTYVMTISTRSMAVEAPDDVSTVLAKHLTLEDVDTGEKIEVEAPPEEPES